MKDIVSINLVHYEAPKGARVLHANSLLFPGTVPSLDSNCLTIVAYSTNTYIRNHSMW
jgi:hypothetical protein